MSWLADSKGTLTHFPRHLFRSGEVDIGGTIRASNSKAEIVVCFFEDGVEADKVGSEVVYCVTWRAG